MKRKTYIVQAIFAFTLIAFCFYGSTAVAIQQLQLPPPERTGNSHPAGQQSHRAQPARQKIHQARPLTLKGDLSVQKLTFSPSKPKIGKPLTFTATIQNTGLLTFKDAVVRFYLNGKKITKDKNHKLKLDAGKSHDVKTTFKVKKPGSFTVKVAVIPKKGQEDIRPQNNSTSVQIIVAAPIQGVRITGPARTPHIERAKPVRNVLGKIYNVKAEIETLAMKGSEHPGVKGWRGKFLDIRWSKKGRMNTRIKILLYPAGQSRLAADGHGAWLTKNASNNGHFSLSLSRIKRTGKYIVRVQTLDNLVFSDSKHFTIPGNVPATHRAPAAAGNVSIAKPGIGPLPKRPLPYAARKPLAFLPLPEIFMGTSNGIGISSPMKNNVWRYKTTHKIKWIVLGASINKVNIKLKNATTKKTTKTIKSSINALSFTFPWTVPSTIPAGTYFIRVSASNNSKIYGESDTFYIAKPLPPKIIESAFINVWSPKSGSIWKSGQTLPIRWYSIGLGKTTKVKITIYPDGKTSPFSIISSGSGGDNTIINTGELLWKIPAKFYSGQFIARVEASNKTVSGDSAPFTLKTSGPSISYSHRAPAYFNTLKITEPIKTTVWKAGSWHNVRWTVLDKQALQNTNLYISLWNASHKKIAEELIINPYSGVASIAVLADTPQGKYTALIEKSDRSAQIESSAFSITNDQKPKNATFKIKDVKWQFSASSTGSVKWIKVFMEVNSNSAFVLGDYGHTQFGAQYLTFTVATPYRLGASAPQTWHSHWKFWIEPKTVKDTFSFTGRGNSSPIQYKTTSFPKGKISYVMTLPTVGISGVEALFWVFKECKQGIDGTPFGPGCLCYGKLSPKLNISLFTYTQNGVSKDTKTIYLTDAPVKSQKINLSIDKGDCPHWISQTW